MRSISADLLAKIQKSQQTIYQNANPTLKILLSKGFRKDLFRVYTIHNDELLESLDVAVRRMDTLGKPNKVYVAYIKNGVAHVKSKDLPYDETIAWDYEFGVGLASEVATEFDGYWEREGTTGRWNLITGEFPYIFKVSSGTLSVQLWNGTPSSLATNVVKVRVIRGWKSAIIGTHDEGLLAVYTKIDGHVYYRNYCEQADGSKIWESEKELTLLPIDTVDIALFRTNDFRTGIIAQDSLGNVSYIVTNRNWAGMAVPPDKISASIPVGDFEVVLYPLMYYVIGTGEYETANEQHQADRFYGDMVNEKINASIPVDDFNVGFLWNSATVPVLAENIMTVVSQPDTEIKVANGTLTEFPTVWHPLVESSEIVYLDSVAQVKDVDYAIVYSTGEITFTTAPAIGVSVSASYDWYSYGHKIRIRFDHGVQNFVGQQVSISVADASLAGFGCQSIDAGETKPFNTTFIGTDEIVLNVQNFNEMDTSLTVSYINGVIQGEAGQSVGDFSISFTPTNLIAPTYMISSPEIEEVWNE